MAVELQELLMGDQASTLASAARGHVATMTLMDRVSVNKFDEPGIVESVAMTLAGKTGENPRYQPQTSPAAV